MSTIEDEARAAAIERYSSRVIEDYDGDRYDEDEYGYDATARSAFVKGALWAASRREPSEREINYCPVHGDLLNRPGDGADARSYRCRNAHNIDEIRGIVPEPPATDEREWEYGYELIESDTRDVLDRGWPYGTAEEARAEGDRRSAEESETSPDLPRVEFYTVRRHHAGPWEVVPDEG